MRTNDIDRELKETKSEKWGVYRKRTPPPSAGMSILLKDTRNYRLGQTI
jgi:hypothetical protein